jgi:hypothetical protein
MAIALGTSTVLLCVNALHAERAGYQFSGTLTGATSSTNLFGYIVPLPSPVSGTFSYDTAPAGGQTGTQQYHQTIAGGLTLNLNNGQVGITASDYTITVGNDQGSTPKDSFDMEYRNFDTNGATVQPLTVTGAEGTSQWTGLADIRILLSWSADTFPDPDLTADKPGTPNRSVTAFVGSAISGSGVPIKLFNTSFAIPTIPSLEGDYNRDGNLSTNDYTEWRKVFGESQPQCLYADGSNDGTVDGRDYIVWRKAVSSEGTGATFGTTIPEPTSLLLAGSGLAVLAMCGRRGHKWADFIGECER